MMLRDTRRDQAYFDGLVRKTTARIERFSAKLAEGSVAADRVPAITRKVFALRVEQWGTRYSRGDELDTLDDLLPPLVAQLPLLHPAPRFVELLWLTSWAVAREESAACGSIAGFLDEENMRDGLLEGLLGRTDRAPLKHDKPYAALLSAFDEPRDASSHIRTYLQRHWYPGHADMGWHGTHTRDDDTYFGYWAFEAAAVARRLGVSAVQLGNVPYFPGDLLG